MTFCGNETCRARLRAWVAMPKDDPQLIPPCETCLRAMAELLQVSVAGPLTLASLRAAVGKGLTDVDV